MNSLATSALTINSATRSFGDTRALNNVSLKLARGAVVAILGQNGAGKTTLIRAALGLLNLDQGSTSLFGQSSHQREARERIGVMLQDSDLPELLTGRELIELFASYYPSPLSCEQTIELADIESFVDKRYKKLSGGQKRRIQFALAIVGNPDLVFLDEPTTGLDTDARRALWSVVRAFAGAGKTIVLTTHYLEEADTLADRIVILKKGEVIADAPTDEIRAVLGGSVIRCTTKLSQAELEKLPHVTHVAAAGRVCEIHTRNAVETLRELVMPGYEVADLSVSRPNLEDVFSREYV